MASVSRKSLGFSSILILVGVFVASPTGCSDDDATPANRDASAQGGGGTGGADGGGGAAGSGQDGAAGSLGDGSAGAGGAGDGAIRLSDNAIAGVMMEANGGEIMAGNVAVMKAQAMSVRSFAQQMVTEHMMANQRLMTLIQRVGITAADSPQRTMVAMMAQQAIAQLNAQPAGMAFDLLYANTQVLMHQQVLMLLDNVLIPSAANLELRADLMTTRAAVASHLSTAQALAVSLGADAGSPVGDGGPGTDGGAGDGGAAADGGATDGAVADAAVGGG